MNQNKKILVNINTIEDYKLNFDKELLKKVL